MKNKKKLALQLELNVYLLLESANKAANALIETQPRGSEAFKASLVKYEAIYNLIQTNQKNGIMNDVLESYLFEAWLAKLQMKENCLTENPENKDELLKNGEELEEIRKSLETLYLSADRFYTALKAKRSELVQSLNFLLDCKETVNSIKAYHASWLGISNRTKANYCYNFATTLIEQSKKETETSEKIVLLAQAHDYTDSALGFYASIRDKTSLKSTKVFLEDIKLILDNLGQKETKKRKSPPTSVEKVAKLTKFSAENDEHREANFQYKDVNEEREISWKENIERMLNQRVESDAPLFYSRLFFEMAARLPRYIDGINSKGVLSHTLLSRLSWLTIAKNLLDLSATKVYPSQMNVLNELNRLNKKHENQLKLISQQKRDQAYPTYSSMQLKNVDLKNIFVSEILDYYWGIEALGFNDIDTVGCWDDILIVTSALVDQEKLYLIKKNKLKEITFIISDNEYLNYRFYAQLLRDLVKFYVDPCNEAWFLSYTALPQALIYKECIWLLEHARRFAISANAGDKTCNNMLEKIYLLNTYLIQKLKQSTSFLAHGEFFKIPEDIKPIQKIVEEHVDFIYQARKFAVATGTVCNHTVEFIAIQCKKFAAELEQSAANSVLVFNTHCF